MPGGSLTSSRIFRDYKVVAKLAESDVITSFTLALADGADAPAYRPGQYLVFRLLVNGAAVLRNYSVSGDPADARVLRIAVKRESAPMAHVPAGLGSNHLHDHVRVGDILTAAGPMGDFVLCEASQRPVVLLSGGVGLTPMMCMLHRLVKSSQRRVFFIHACENGKVHAFANEVRALAGMREGVAVHFCYRSPDSVDLGFHSQGLLAREQLQALLPLDDYDFYLCGPGLFMQANWRMLRGLGVDQQRIHYEFFGPATVLEEQGAPAEVVAERVPVVPEASVSQAPTALPAIRKPEQMQVESNTAATGLQVSFMPSGTVVDWSDGCESLLELAELSGLNPDFNCRAGLCNTCMSTLVSGQIEYFEPPLDDPPPGRMLLCCSRPLGPVVIEIDA
ncbi:2Fe-2S iron-sulfur cluster binding domain-containing protein [Alcaligenaceae bacterium]|nr:2Fe-2S iron-sulfur cluster binding domain-containing protein [Alcaligenaceae bacterium]